MSERGSGMSALLYNGAVSTINGIGKHDFARDI
jgi:hypothetical protein